MVEQLLPTGPADFWEQPEMVEKFAARDPDHRLLELIDRYRNPKSTRILDLGCAAGRNTLYLLRERFDVVGVDSSRAMVARTRSRAIEIVGREEAMRRVFPASLDDLSFAEDDQFDLVVALGIYHEASTEGELRRSLAETRRVLVRDGLCLVAVFGPGTGRRGAPHPPIEGTRTLHRGSHGRVLCLLTAAELDEEFEAQGMLPEVATEAVERGDEENVRITINGLYRKKVG